MIFTAPVGSVAETAETKFLDFGISAGRNGWWMVHWQFDSRDVDP